MSVKTASVFLLSRNSLNMTKTCLLYNILGPSVTLVFEFAGAELIRCRFVPKVIIEKSRGEVSLVGQTTIENVS